MDQPAPHSKVVAVFVLAVLALLAGCTALYLIVTQPRGLTSSELNQRINAVVYQRLEEENEQRRRMAALSAEERNKDLMLENDRTLHLLMKEVDKRCKELSDRLDHVPPSPAAGPGNATSAVKPWLPPSEKVKALLQEELAIQLQARDAAQIMFERGLKDSAELMQVQRALLCTQLELCTTKEERQKVYAEMLGNLRKFEELAKAREQAGQVTKLDVMLAKNERLLTEIKMERESE